MRFSGPQVMPNLEMWRGRDPMQQRAHRPSLSALHRVQQLQGVSPMDVPYGGDEQELAFQAQAHDAEGQLQVFNRGTRFDPMRGGWQRDPVIEKAAGDVMGGQQWAGYADQTDRARRMAEHRGFNYRADLAGDGPGSGVGRLKARVGDVGPFGSFRGATPSIDIESLMNDSRRGRPADQQMALRALTLLTRGR